MQLSIIYLFMVIKKVYNAKFQKTFIVHLKISIAFQKDYSLNFNRMWNYSGNTRDQKYHHAKNCKKKKTEKPTKWKLRNMYFRESSTISKILKKLTLK